MGLMTATGFLAFLGVLLEQRRTSAEGSERNEAFRSRIAERNALFQSNLG